MPTKPQLKLLHRAILLASAALFLWILSPNLAHAGNLHQQPTGSIATVTGTPSGPIVTVNTDNPQINVRSGPNTFYPEVGVLIAGQQVVATGRTPGGDWIQIVYPGVPGGLAWIYSGLVTVGPGNLPVVEPPPTPTPLTTPTVDPTLAAQFDLGSTPTRLPTFTPPPPLVIPSFDDGASLRRVIGIPMGFVITTLGVIGVFGLTISFLRRG
ncbi:MAG TPA: SH3 domain-containing protein [Anaerolineales bacterium]|nr:SH3 domain-containing protein [Anaerolineales bacterium]